MRASFATMRMSHMDVSSVAPARHQPCTWAITGLASSQMNQWPIKAWRDQS